MSNNNISCMSKPPKFEGKRGSAYVIWSIKFRSWAGVKGVRATLAPSFNSKLAAMEEAVLDDTDPTLKAQGKAILQKCYSYGHYGAVYEQNRQHPLRSSKHARRCGLAYQKGTEDMAEHPESLSTHGQHRLKGLSNGFAKDQVEEKDVNPMKILSEISVVEVRFKQSLSKEKKVEVVQGCMGDNYAQIIVVTDGLSRIESQRNATAHSTRVVQSNEKGVAYQRS
jgi:hypothetical protein